MSQPTTVLPTLDEVAIRYRNDSAVNDAIYAEFARLSQTIPFLREHRKYIEANRLGFGDLAFHGMWWLLVRDLAARAPKPRLLEIGVYKGQILSLWALIAAREGLPVALSAVSPLEGQPLPRSIWVRRWKWLTSRGFRDACRAGNFYEENDYRALIRGLFERFGLQFDAVEVFQGYSTDSAIRSQLAERRFDLVYIDGDHTYAGAAEDIRWFAPRVEPRGYLVMDDASFFLPGNAFWKGYETVSRAAELIPRLGFKNVLNVGHNRVFQRTP